MGWVSPNPAHCHINIRHYVAMTRRCLRSKKLGQERTHRLFLSPWTPGESIAAVGAKAGCSHWCRGERIRTSDLLYPKQAR